MSVPTCSVHPGETDFYEFPAHPKRKPRCKSCVKDGRRASALKKSEKPTDAPADGNAPAAAPRPRGPGKAKPGPARARAGWHWSWGPPPGGWKGPASKSPDAWGPYKRMTDDELRFRKSRRGTVGLVLGYAWLSKEEWAAAELKMKERAEELAKKYGRGP